MSIKNTFFLRSSHGAGFIYFKVAESQVAEICLFQDRISFEVYPLKLQNLISKATAFLLAEVSEQDFEDAQQLFFERSNAQSAVAAKVIPLPTSKQMEFPQTVIEAWEDDMPF
jgi:hypothetical protein